jgi:PEGA domain
MEQRERDGARTTVDEARGRAQVAREHSLKLNAERLAKDLFDAATAKETEASQLGGRQRFAEAARAYQDAVDRYGEATRRTQAVLETRAQAERARSRMVAAKQSAHRDANEFGAGVAREEQGHALYERQAFQEAAESYREATALFVRALPKPPTPPPPSPVGSVAITANHSGADVWVGHTQAVTKAGAPVAVGQFPPGRYPVTVRLGGFKEWRGEVEVLAGRQAALVITLEPLPPPEPPRGSRPRAVPSF